VKVDADGIQIESPFPVKVKTNYQSDPPRAIVDLTGAKLESFTEIEMPASARISQLDGNIVRIILDTDRRIVDSPELSRPLRSLELTLGPAPAGSPLKDPEVSRPPGFVPAGGSQDPILIEPPLSLADTEIPPGSRLKVFAGPLQVLQDSSTAATLSFSLTGLLSGAPKISRPLPNVLRVVFPGARYTEAPEGTPYKGSVEQVAFEQFDHAVVVEITLSRPMGLEMSYTDQEVRLLLIKPQVGDGKLAGKTIVVDAGHGGHDSGARSPDKRTREKDLTLKIATKVASALAAEGATVIMTRKSDVFIPLKERSEVANRNEADFFISCHINSNESSNSSSGTISFHHAQDSDSILLAESIQVELKKTAKLPSMGVWSDQRIYDNGFAVLRYAKMPAVLLELGFINNRSDRARMTSETYPSDVARAVVRGLRVYLGDVKN
jgi:N-acetylmuramoyl-L-alanine amidase